MPEPPSAPTTHIPNYNWTHNIMKLPDPGASASFTPTPAGQHVCVLTRLIDLGTQPGSAMYPKPKRKVLFGWEIPGERIQYEKDGKMHEGPVVHFERMTFSAHENAIMRQRLESWRGKQFTAEEFGTFDMKTLLGVGALIQISHSHDDGKTYANMQAIVLPPGGKSQWPQPEGDIIYLSLEPGEFDQAVFDNLSSGLQETIKGSPEYEALHSTPAAPAGFSDVRRIPESALDDEIPF